MRLLAVGAKRFPEDQTIARLLEESISGEGASPEELKMLKSLGYIE